MSAKSIIGADIKAKQGPTEKQDINVVVFVNVIFSLLNNNVCRRRNDNGIMDGTDITGTMADVVKEHTCYHANISLEKNPEKIYAYECFVPCQDLFFNDKGECIDTIGSYSKILYACIELDNYLKKQVFPIGSKIQVCINAIGFEVIEDIVWGFAFMADACCPNNVEDELLNEWIMDEYEPFFIEYLKKGWKINVTYISLLEYGIVYEVYEKKQLSINNPTENNKRNGEKANNNFNFEKWANANQKMESNSCSTYRRTDATNADIINTSEKEPSLKLEGYISKTEINLSSFFSLDHILDTIPPFNAIRFLDRLTGVDKIEEKINDNAVKSINAFINGNADKGWMYLKQAGGSTLDYIHKRLEVISFVPGPGTVAGLVDGTIYIAQELTAIFGENDLQKAEELRNKAFWSYLAAIPFTKIIKYGKPVFKAGKVLSKGSEKVRLRKVAIELFEKAQMSPKPKTKASIKEFKNSRNNLRKINSEIREMISQPEYQNALKEYGVKYKDAVSNIHFGFLRGVKALNGKNTPKSDVFQSFIFQLINPYSFLREQMDEKTNKR